MNATETEVGKTPPPLKRFSAEEFRQWLAGMVNQNAPPTQTERDAMKSALVEFLSTLPLVYGFDDRLTMWEKIGNAAQAAWETCNNDLTVWANATLEGIDANPGRVASCEPLANALSRFASQMDAWRVECLRVLRDLRLILPVLARDRWNNQVKGAVTDGN